MKKLLLILLIVGAAGCGYKEGETVAKDDIPTAIIIDSCEYFKWYEVSGSINITHKGNCKNCRKFYKELLKEK